MKQSGCRAARVSLALLALLALGCDGDSASATDATQVRVLDQGLVDAPHVEAALQALWPLAEAQTLAEARLSALESRAAGWDDAAESWPPGGRVPTGPDGAPQTVEEALVAMAEGQAALHTALAEALARLDAAEADRDALQAQLDDATAALQDALEAQAASTAQQLEDLDAKWSQPSACPDDTVELSDRACIEAAPRDKVEFELALTICTNNGRRLCALQEVRDACRRADEIGLLASIKEHPHWFGDGGGRLMTANGIWFLSGKTLGGLVCSRVNEASEFTTAEGTDATMFPYRCCVDR